MDVGGSVQEAKRLGQVIATARKAAGFTQQALCHQSGLSYSTLAKIERGAIKTPSVFTIKLIADTIGMGVDDLLRQVTSEIPAPSRALMAPTGRKQVSRNGVRFVYFDMNGVLVRAAVTKACLHLSRESGVTPDVIETIFWQHNNDVCRGSMSIDEFNTILAERLGMLVDWNKYYLDAVEATPGIAEFVGWVAENYHLGIVTNTFPDLVDRMFQRSILPAVSFDVVIDSSDVHALKPEARMFEVAAERAGVQPEEILLIDDDRLNLAAAGQMGWHTMSFDAYQPEDSIVSVSTALQPAD